MLSSNIFKQLDKYTYTALKYSSSKIYIQLQYIQLDIYHVAYYFDELILRNCQIFAFDEHVNNSLSHCVLLTIMSLDKLFPILLDSDI